MTPATSRADGPGGRALGGRTSRSRIRRVPDAARYDRATLYGILDEAPYCHVGFVLDGAPVVLPTIHDRLDDVLYLHGSRSNRMLRCSTAPTGACVTATLFDGLVLARSVFNHSVNYRSAVVFGRPVPVEDGDEKEAVLRHLVEHVLPGRSGEARPPNARELTATSVLRMPIEEASAKVDGGLPDDDPDDFAYPVWAGTVPLVAHWGEPVTDPRGTGEGAGQPVPASVRALLGRGTPFGR